MKIKILGISVLAIAGNAFAQSDGQTEVGNGIRIEELVVTASKKAETVLTSPVAVTAITSEEITSAGVVGLGDLNAVAPSLQVRTTGGTNAITFSIRGVSNADIFELSNPPVATYIDGVVIGRPDALGGIMHDIEQIEVLRGPQGTLYGRNSTGGNVNILTAKPFQGFDASASLSYGSYNEVQTRAMVNFAATDTLAIRASFAQRENEGLYDTEDSTTRDYGIADELSARISTLWEPTENFDWHLTLEGYSTKGTPGLGIITGPNGRPIDGKDAFDPRPVYDNSHEPDMDGSNLMVRSNMSWDVGDNTTVSYIAGYQEVESKMQNILGYILHYRDTPTEATSHEINVQFANDRLENIFGVSYLDQDYVSSAVSVLPSIELLATVTSQINTEAIGVFNQTNFNLTDDLRLIGGVRYTTEEFSLSDAYQGVCFGTDFPIEEYPLKEVNNTQLEIIPASPTCTLAGFLYGGNTSGALETDEVTWKAGLSYDVSENTATYATISKGFKAAGINFGPSLTADLAEYEPEEVMNYEVGYKTRLLDNRLSLNTALYFMDYTNIQVSQLLDLGNGNFVNLTRNAAGAENYGAEIEWTYDVSDNGTFTGFLNYVNATYTEFVGAFDGQTNTTVDASGNFLPYAPEYSIQASYEHLFPLSNGGSLVPKATVYWQSESFIQPLNYEADKIDSYTKTDLSLSYNDPSGQWKVEGFVHNLENEEVRNGGWVFVGSYLSSFSMPRTYGARVSFRY